MVIPRIIMERKVEKKPEVVDQDYGDFEEVKEELPAGTQPLVPSMPIRVRVPRNGELIGVITQRLGGNKMDVNCSDGKSRNCRVPGRFSRSLWLRPKDIVLVKPWEFDNSKADVIFKYEGGAIHQLRKRGLLDNVKNEF